MSSEDALIRLAQSSSEAAMGVLEMFAPGQVQAGDIAVLDAGAEPLSGLPFPAVATNVAYVDGVTGGNVFVMTFEGARRLAGAMMGQTEIEPSDATELTELELSAVSEAGNQMMATAAAAISSVLETEVEIGVAGDPLLRVRRRRPPTPTAPRRTSSRAAFSVCGEPCRLVQLVPNAFVVRMDRALDDLEHRATPAAAGARPPAGGRPATASPRCPGSRCACGPSWAATYMPSADVVELPGGAVVELNENADDPIDLYVNGTPLRDRPPDGGREQRVGRADRNRARPFQRDPENDMEVARWPVSW